MAASRSATKCGLSAANIIANKIIEAKEPTVYGINLGSRNCAMRRPSERSNCWRRAADSMTNASEIALERSLGGVGRGNRLKLRVSDRNSTTSARQTGHLSRCSSIATRFGNDTQSSMYNESDCLVSSHNIEEFSVSIATHSRN